MPAFAGMAKGEVRISFANFWAGTLAGWAKFGRAGSEFQELLDILS